MRRGAAAGCRTLRHADVGGAQPSLRCTVRKALLHPIRQLAPRVCSAPLTLPPPPKTSLDPITPWHPPAVTAIAHACVPLPRYLVSFSKAAHLASHVTLTLTKDLPLMVGPKAGGKGCVSIH